METRKLYYEDCTLRRFAARVTGCRETDAAFAVTLDATAFYPEGGGQACDVGVLGGVRVLDVQETGAEVIHLCQKPLTVGETVTGEIDWSRRFALMQQHTGEHIVSGLVHKRWGYSNVGFHMGSEIMEVDFDGPIPAEAIEELERDANEAVWANQPVRCWVPSPEELPHVAYRTKRALPWPVRIVQVGDTDSCACCGIHTAFTGEVGLIKILSCVKFHSGVRMEITCGTRALAYVNRLLDQNRQVSQAFSAKPTQTGEAARRMNTALAAEKFRATGLEKKLFEKIAEDYRGAQHVLRFEPDLSPAALRELTESIAKYCSGIAAVISGEENNYMVCLAQPGGDVKTLGNAMTKALWGKGGGKPGFFQGSLNASREQIESFFMDNLPNCILK